MLSNQNMYCAKILSYYNFKKDITINRKCMIVFSFVKMGVKNGKINIIIIHTNFISYFWTYFIISFYLNSNSKVFGDFGGHDLFASVSQLEDLWHNERQTVSIIEKVLEIMNDPPMLLNS